MVSKRTLKIGDQGKMTVKLVVFDLDGVLIDSKQTHYEALNRALGS